MTRASILLVLIAGCAVPAPARDPEEQFRDTMRNYDENPDARAALAGVEEVLKSRPEWAEAHAARAHLLLAIGQAAEALKSYDRAIELQPGLLDAVTARGILLAELGRSAEAERDFNAIIAAIPTASDGYLLRAWLERRTGRFSEAERDLAEARSRDPVRWEAYHNLGAVAAQGGRWMQAARSFELALLLRPDHVDGWLALSRAHASQGLKDRALEDLDRADREAPGAATVSYARAELLRSLGRPGEAARAYDRAIALGAIPIMYAGRAQVRLALNDAKGAETDFTTALELEPTLREAWVARARWRASEGRFEEARADYAAALRLRASATILRELARLHHDRELWDPAVAAYESALRICDEPGLKPALERDLADAKAHKK